jgi:hypothetical protein
LDSLFQSLSDDRKFINADFDACGVPKIFFFFFFFKDCSISGMVNLSFAELFAVAHELLVADIEVDRRTNSSSSPIPWHTSWELAFWIIFGAKCGWLWLASFFVNE